MKNVFLVTLDTTTTPHTLAVSDRGKADVAQKRHPQTLIWILADELAKGQFADPGFAFTTAPPPGIFGTPAPGSGGNFADHAPSASPTVSATGVAAASSASPTPME